MKVAETTQQNKVLKLEILHDSDPTNPFTDWDCEPALMFYGGRNCSGDYSKGEIHEQVLKAATFNKIIRHQKTLCEILEISHEYFQEYQFTPDEKVSDIESEISRANIKQLTKLCELFKIPYLNYNSTGYSQGDWANVLIVLTDEFFERSGCEKKNSKEILQGTKNLFDAWAWGDVYGFRLYEVSTCDKCNEEHEEEIDSCWGFYGRDFEENGMMDHLPKEAHDLLKNFDKSEIIYM